MLESVGYEEVVGMLRGAVAEIGENHEVLSELDSFGGDGDHGTTMVRAMNKLEAAVEACEAKSVKGLLHDVGWAVMGVDGGATGPLFGTLFMSMSDAAGDGDALDCQGVAAMFEAGLAGVRKRTRAQVGDKTMLDALVPAVEAFSKAAADGATISVALGQAAEAALLGAQSTKELQARFGRAKNIGEASAGHQDPGATSVSFVFKGFAKGVA